MSLYIDDYLELLETAELQDRISPAEEDFIAGLREKHDNFGKAAYISQAQIDWLERIVERE